MVCSQMAKCVDGAVLYHIARLSHDRRGGPIGTKRQAFAEGHYLQIEVAGLITTKGAKKIPLASQFLEFMISPAFQDIIPKTNWMLAGCAHIIGRTQSCRLTNGVQAGKMRLLFSSDEEIASKIAKQWIDEWLEVMSR